MMTIPPARTGERAGVFLEVSARLRIGVARSSACSRAGRPGRSCARRRRVRRRGVGGAVVAARAALANRAAVGCAADAWRAGDGAEDCEFQVGSA